MSYDHQLRQQGMDLTPAEGGIRFLNKPKLAGDEVSRAFDERRQRLVPEIRRLLENMDLFAGKEVTAEFAQTGVSSLVAFVKACDERYVLKVPLSLTDGNGEAEFLIAWEAAGIRVPHVFADGHLGQHPYVLMEHVDAPPLIDKIEDGSAKKEVWAEMGQTLARMHAIPAAGFGRIVNGQPQQETFKGWILSEDIAKRIRYVQEQGLLGDEHGSIEEALQALLEFGAQQPSSTRCHFDYSPPNILATQPLTVFDPSPMLNLGIIDLGRSVISSVFMGHPEESGLIVEGYCNALETSLDTTALQAAILLNAYWKLPFQHRKGHDAKIAAARQYLAQHVYK